MSTMNPAAAIMQQNKQAELGRREDRAQSQQNMLATLMTLFMQGKMSREQLDAQMKIAGERIAADRDINAATLQTHKDINSANITSNEKMAGRQIQMQEDDMKFRRTVAELSLKSNFADKLAAIAQSGRDVTTAMGASSISQLYRDQADWEGKQEVAMQATKGAATKEEYAQNLIKNMQTSQQDMKMILANTLAARGVGMRGLAGLVVLAHRAASSSSARANAARSAAQGGVETIDASSVLPEVPDAARGPFLQLWPHRHGTDAMFLALLRRTA